jgi:Cu(I)/Ag(I) efflux system membrane fusion protein
VVVPRDAVIDTGELQYVFLAQGGGRYLPRRVRTGWSGSGKVAILEGVREGERVVTAAGFLLDSESRLRATGAGGGGHAHGAAPAAAAPAAAAPPAGPDPHAGHR